MSSTQYDMTTASYVMLDDQTTVNTTMNATHVMIEECRMEKQPVDHSQEFYATATSTEFFE